MFHFRIDITDGPSFCPLSAEVSAGGILVGKIGNRGVGEWQFWLSCSGGQTFILCNSTFDSLFMVWACLFYWFQHSCVLSQQSWFWVFFLFFWKLSNYTGCGAAEATGLGFVCFVVINPDLCFFCFINFPILSPPPLQVVLWVDNLPLPQPVTWALIAVTLTCMAFALLVIYCMYSIHGSTIAS